MQSALPADPPPRQRSKTGVLNVNKPVGITSFGVVARVRRATGVRRVGHAGTLDPLASGVLLVCIGQATRIISYLQDSPKTYLAGIRLGRRTDTFDAEGRVIEELPVPERLDLQPYVGHIRQTPPMYSALKRDGRPLYDYARKGEEVALEPRDVRIDSIELISWTPPDCRLRIVCGKGAYIRSLANDLGGHLTSLVREAVGDFRVERAVSLDELSAWENELMPIPAALPRLPHVTASPAEVVRLRQGLPIQCEAGEALAMDDAGQAVAIVDAGQPKIVFGAA
ncbi:MAG TPA: tRNA pseudouridine(55) synthase TruB [Chloroflexota bacterium]|nr:tRNA pseudouridine(55) synthase TruB [Chloroflexota bacterium]